MKLFILILLIGFCCLSFEQMDFNKEKAAAFTVLEEKCNDCHLKKKRVVFTLDNMETQAAEINRQVFIKKRMPKGKKFPLTEKEFEILKNWLGTLGIS